MAIPPGRKPARPILKPKNCFISSLEILLKYTKFMPLPEHVTDFALSASQVDSRTDTVSQGLDSLTRWAAAARPEQ